MPTSRITIHMVSSLDGYVANNDNTVDWMHSHDSYEKGTELTKEYIDQYLASIDCYVMGSYTYEQAIQLGWPYEETAVKVLTSRNLQKEKDTVEFVNGDLRDIVNNLLLPCYSNIWMVGGPTLASELLDQGLADAICITIVPILLGNGLPFFKNLQQNTLLHLSDVTCFTDGTVEIMYEITQNL